MINPEEHCLIKEIERIAQISAETFTYNKTIDPNARNNYPGNNETEGMCSDYALKFVLDWNESHPENQAEIIVINQPKYFMKNGSYKIVKKITYDPSRWRWSVPSGFEPSQILQNNDVIPGCYHPKLGFYELNQTKIYTVKIHFGVDMVNEFKGPHVWARVGDIAVDPCWADTDKKPFTGIDIID